MTQKEVWRDIPGYEGYYQASNLGRVRSLDRTILTTNGQERFYKGKIKKGSVNNKGYTQYSLNINGIGRNFMRSQIISMTFLGHEPNGHKLVVDHIDGDISDDRVENLRIVTQRANTSTCFRSDEDSLSSEYAGVYWNKNTSKWMARIYHEGVRLYLGLYNTEVEASNYYQSALSKIKDGSFNPNDYKPEFSSQYKGVVFDKNRGKWMARITVNGKNKHLGRFNNEIDASNAYKEALSKIKDGTFNPNDYKPKFASKYKGVYYSKKNDRWFAQIRINKKTKAIGTFKTEIEAHEAYQNKLKNINIL